ncbi:MAG TPA: VWA domain-containing protein [Thermoanaerobaculia bacterium]|nr:VWA domain-containing protein [Thermoanaerobaculia bacterium]
MLHRRAAVPFATLFLAALALAGPPAAVRAQEQSFAEETSVVVVEVPVQVLEDGKPVRGLTAADFEAFDGKTPRAVTAFEVVDLAASSSTGAAPASAPAAAPSPAARRHFMLFFDLYFTTTRSLVAAEQAARKLLAEGLHPTDLVGIAFFSNARGVTVPLNFTADRAQAAAALDDFRALLLRDEAGAGRLGLSPRDVAAIGGQIGSGFGEKDNLAMALLEEDYYTEGLPEMALDLMRSNYQQGRSEVEVLTQGLGAMARATASIDGRKHLILFSDGFVNNTLRGERFMRRGRASGGSSALADASAYGDLERMAEQFRRANWVIHTVEAFGLSGNWDPTGFSSEGLWYMAKETGGSFLSQTNDLSEAMARVLETSTVTYVLTLEAPDIQHDGKYHKLDVRLRGGRKGKVVHRAGYYAPRPLGQAASRRMAKAIELLLGPERSDLQTTALATPFRAPEGGAYVPVVIEVDATSLAAEGRGATHTLEFYGYALDPQREVADYFSQVVRYETARHGESVRAGGVRFVGDLYLAPGKYDLRLLVRSADSGRATVRSLPLEVPDFGKVASRLLQPFFVQPERGGLTVREVAGGVVGSDAYPFVAGGQVFVPSAMPVVKAGEQVRVFLAGYNLSTQNVEVEGRVLGSDGREVRGMRFKPLGRDVSAAGLDHLVATLQVGRVQPGEYTLEVSMLEPDPQGLAISLGRNLDRQRRAVTSKAAFKVGGKPGS